MVLQFIERIFRVGAVPIELRNGSDLRVQGRHQQPHDLLGQHLEPGGLRIRVLKPLAQSVQVRFEDGVTLDLEHEAEGVWTAVRPDATHDGLPARRGLGRDARPGMRRSA